MFIRLHIWSWEIRIHANKLLLSWLVSMYLFKPAHFSVSRLFCQPTPGLLLREIMMPKTSQSFTSHHLEVWDPSLLRAASANYTRIRATCKLAAVVRCWPGCGTKTLIHSLVNYAPNMIISKYRHGLCPQRPTALWEITHTGNICYCYCYYYCHTTDYYYLVNILHRHMSSILTANQRLIPAFEQEMTEIQRFLGNFSIEFTISKWHLTA